MKKIINEKLIESARDGNLKGIREALQSGADIHAWDDEALPIVSDGCFRVLEVILVHAAKFKSDSALIAAAMNGYIDTIKLLLQNGANIHACDESALIIAAINGYTDIVKLLLAKGANVHARDDEALRRAVYSNYFDVVELLLKCGANVHADDDCALLEASKLGYVDIARLLIKHGANVHARNDEAIRLAAMLPCKKQRKRIVKLLLKNGARVTDEQTKIMLRGVGLKSYKFIKANKRRKNEKNKSTNKRKTH